MSDNIENTPNHTSNSQDSYDVLLGKVQSLWAYGDTTVLAEELAVKNIDCLKGAGRLKSVEYIRMRLGNVKKGKLRDHRFLTLMYEHVKFREKMLQEQL